MVETTELAISRASQLTIPNKDWTHYRSGLKLRCTKTPGGVTLSVVSQGKSIDNTFVVGGNVRFLTKQPIVGLKVFDGERLQKRLQITFAAEADFNMFSNRIRQWVGVDVLNNGSIAAQSETAQGEVSYSQGHSQNAQPQNIQSQNLQSQNIPSQNVQSQNVQSQGIPSQNVHSQNNASQGLSQNFPCLSQNASGISQHSSQIPDMSQCAARYSAGLGAQNRAHSSQFAPTSDLDPRSNQQNTSRTFDPFSALLNAASTEYSPMEKPANADHSRSSEHSRNLENSNTRSADYLNTMYNGFNDSILSQSTQMWKETSNTTLSQQKITGADLTRSLRELPSTERISKPKKKRGVDRILESTISSVLQDQGPSLLALDDPALILKVTRKLKSKSFIRLLERLETLLE